VKIRKELREFIHKSGLSEELHDQLYEYVESSVVQVRTDKMTMDDAGELAVKCLNWFISSAIDSFYNDLSKICERCIKYEECNETDFEDIPADCVINKLERVSMTEIDELWRRIFEDAIEWI